MVPGFPSNQAQDLAFMPDLPHYLVATASRDFSAVGRGNGGVYVKTGMSAQAWLRVGGVFPAVSTDCPQYPSAYGISIAPDTHTVYVGTDCGLAVGTEDSSVTGFTFHALTLTPASGEPPFPTGHGADPMVASVLALGGGHLIIGGPRIGVWYSADSGATWRKEITGVGAVGEFPPDIHAFGADPRGGGRAYAVTADTKLWETSTYGQSWSAIANAPSGLNGAGQRPCGGITNVHAVSISSVVWVYFGNSCDTFASRKVNFVWDTWQRQVTQHSDPRDMVFHNGTNLPYLISGDGGVERDESGTWKLVGGPAHGLDADQVTEVFLQYVPGGADLYFTTQHNLIWSMAGTSGTVAGHDQWEGFSFQGALASDGGPTDKFTYMACSACDNRQSGRHFAPIGSFSNAEHTIDDAGNPTGPVNGPAFAGFVGGHDRYVQAVDGSSDHRAYADGSPSHLPGLQYTTDDGATWNQIANIPDPMYGLPKIAGSIDNPVMYQAVHHGLTGDPVLDQVYLTRITDWAGGISPTPTGNCGSDTHCVYAAMNGFGVAGVTPTAFAWYEQFAVDPVHPARIIAPDTTHHDLRYTLDGGDNWMPIPGSNSVVTGAGQTLFGQYPPEAHCTWYGPGYCRPIPNASTMSICPWDDSRVMMGTRQGGVYWSYDGGMNWNLVTGSESISYATSVAWTWGCGSAYLSTYSRGIFLINMGLVRQTIPTTQPCNAAPLICALRQRLLQVFPHPKPGGIVVSDGWISKVTHSGSLFTVHVTNGSVVFNYGSAPKGVKIVTDKGMAKSQGKYTFAVFFRNGALTNTVSLKTPDAFDKLAPGKLGAGLSKLPKLPAQIEMTGDFYSVHGTGYPVLQAGAPLNLDVTINQPSSYEAYLMIDGQVVAKADPGAQSLSYGEKQGNWAQGMHVALLCFDDPAAKTPDSSCVADQPFQIVHDDDGK